MDIGTVLRDFVYNHTELAIWTFIVLTVIVVFWLMVYSVTIRLFMTIVILITVLLAYGLYYYLNTLPA